MNQDEPLRHASPGKLQSEKVESGAHGAGLPDRQLGAGPTQFIDRPRDQSTVQVVHAEPHVPAPGEEPSPFMNSIGPGYFAALGVPVVAGRDFRLSDTEQVKHGDGKDDYSPRVVMVNERKQKYLLNLYHY